MSRFMDIKEIRKYPGEFCFIGPEYPGDLRLSKRFKIIQEIGAPLGPEYLWDLQEIHQYAGDHGP